MIDESTTALELAHLLPAHGPLTVITNFLAAINSLTQKSDVDLIALGGSYNGIYDAFHGLHVREAISRLQADRIHLDNGDPRRLPVRQVRGDDPDPSRDDGGCNPQGSARRPLEVPQALHAQVGGAVRLRCSGGRFRHRRARAGGDARAWRRRGGGRERCRGDPVRSRRGRRKTPRGASAPA